MTAKTFLIAAALTILPGLAMAAGCIHGQEQQAMSCGQGSTWDTGSETCKPIVNG